MEQGEAIKTRDRGKRAASLLENETLGAAFDEVIADIDEKFHQTQTHDVPMLQALNAQYRAIAAVRQKMKQYVNSGKEADRQLSRRNG